MFVVRVEHHPGAPGGILQAVRCDTRDHHPVQPRTGAQPGRLRPRRGTLVARPPLRLDGVLRLRLRDARPGTQPSRARWHAAGGT